MSRAVTNGPSISANHTPPKGDGSETAAIIVAAGSGSRFGGEIPKQYQPLAGQPLLTHALARFARHPNIGRIVVAIHPDHRALFDQAAEGLTIEAAVPGGEDRQASVRMALEHLSSNPPARVLIQDGARPLPSSALIDRVIGALATDDAAIPVMPVTDTLITGENSLSGEPVSRENLFRVQTPQGFRYPMILEAHRHFAEQGFTDDAGLARAAGHAVRLVAGEEKNVKITRQEDAEAVERLLLGRQEARTGSGFDVHRLGPPSPAITALRLGGVDIPFNRALIGHSDADVALHAITDALLGALGAGDIGQHFPPSDATWKGMDSAHFLEQAARMARECGATITLIDLTIICQQPRIGPYREALIRRIAGILDIAEKRVNVKATTTEGLGFTGRAEGIAATASASIMMPGE